MSTEKIPHHHEIPVMVKSMNTESRLVGARGWRLAVVGWGAGAGRGQGYEESVLDGENVRKLWRWRRQ